MMDSKETNELKQKQNATLFFNIAIMIASFTIALIALPQEIFFVVAIIILFVLREIEKEIGKTKPKNYFMMAHRK